MIFADTAFQAVSFIHNIRKLKRSAITIVPFSYLIDRTEGIAPNCGRIYLLCKHLSWIYPWCSTWQNLSNLFSGISNECAVEVDRQCIFQGEKLMAITGTSTPERQTAQGYRIPDYSKNNYKELMNILNGFGYINPEDQSNDADKKALIAFQKYMKITADGVYGPKTQEKLAEAMRILHANLNKVLGTNFSFNEPFYIMSA